MSNHNNHEFLTSHAPSSEELFSVTEDKSVTEGEAVTEDEACEAVRVLLRWMGENPRRPGLEETPSRVSRLLKSLNAGSKLDPRALLTPTFTETGGYAGHIMVSNISFRSTCEHHLLPILGTVNIGYQPEGCVAGLSSFTRLVRALANRLQLQERLTLEIANAITEGLGIKSVGVVVSAQHLCMQREQEDRGEERVVTTDFRGAYLTNTSLQCALMSCLQPTPPRKE